MQAITLDESGDMLGGITIKNMVFDCGSHACRNDTAASAGRNRDRRFVTLSETRAIFESVGTYLPGEGLTLFGEIIYAGPTKEKPIDIELKEISNVTASESANGEDNKKTVVTISAVMGTVVFVLVAIAIGFWHNHKRAANEAFDFASEIARLRKEKRIGTLGKGDEYFQRNIPRELKRKDIRKIDTLGKGMYGLFS